MATETGTLLFTGLVGSTELLSRVGEVVADELRREHFGALRIAISGHGGREINNLGDGLMVAFGGVGPALGCAVAMQQAIAGRRAARSACCGELFAGDRDVVVRGRARAGEATLFMPSNCSAELDPGDGD